MAGLARKVLPKKGSMESLTDKGKGGEAKTQDMTQESSKHSLEQVSKKKLLRGSKQSIRGSKQSIRGSKQSIRGSKQSTRHGSKVPIEDQIVKKKSKEEQPGTDRSRISRRKTKTRTVKTCSDGTVKTVEFTSVEHHATGDSHDGTATHKHRVHDFIDPLTQLNHVRSHDLSLDYPFIGWTLPFCVVYSMFDVNYLNTFGANVIEHGGIWFLLAYFFLTFCITIPLIDIFLTLGKCSRMGASKFIEVFCPALRTVATGVTIVILMNAMYGLSNISSRVSLMSHIMKNPNTFLSCNVNPTGSHVDIKLDPLYNTYCVSQASTQGRTVNKNYSEGSNISALYYSSTFINIMDRIYQEKAITDDRFLFFSMYAMVMIGILLLVGPFITSCFGAVSFFASFGMVLTVLKKLYELGYSQHGLSLMVKITDIEQLMTLQSLEQLVFFVCGTSSTKFVLISLGALLPQTSNTALIATSTTVMHSILLLMVTAINFCVVGSFTSPEYDVSPISVGDMTFQSLLPEFYGMMNGTGIGPDFVLHIKAEMAVTLAQIAMPVFVFHTYYNDHLSRLASIWQKLLLSTVVAIMSVILVMIGGGVYDLLSENIMYKVTALLGNYVLLLVLLGTRYAAGERELGHDFEHIFKYKKNANQSFIYLYTAFVRYNWSQATSTLLIIVSGLYVIIALPVLVSEMFKGTTLWIEMMVCFLFFVACLIQYLVDIYFFHKTTIPFWRVFYPSVVHPMYGQILYSDHGQFSELNDLPKCYLSDYKSLQANGQYAEFDDIVGGTARTLELSMSLNAI